MRESNLMRLIQLRATELGARLFRNNVARGWIGEHKQLPDGSVLIKNPRRLHAGLCVGSSDLIGWMPVTITPDMVGKTVAVFVACETKSKRGKPSEDQVRFNAAVRDAGGIAFVARSEAQAEDALGSIAFRPSCTKKQHP